MTLPTFLDGVLVNAAALNSLSTAVTNLNVLLTGANPPRAYVPTVTAHVTSAPSISNNSETVLTMGAADINNDGMWSSGVNHFTVQTAGTYTAWAQVRFVANGTGYRGGHIMLNGTTPSSNAVAAFTESGINSGDGNQHVCITPPLALSVGAALYFSVIQTSGGSLATSIADGTIFFSAIRIGP